MTCRCRTLSAPFQQSFREKEKTKDKKQKMQEGKCTFSRLKALSEGGVGDSLFEKDFNIPAGGDLFIELTRSTRQGAWARARGMRDGGDRVEPVGALTHALQLALVISQSSHHPSHPSFVSSLACYSRAPFLTTRAFPGCLFSEPKKQI